MNLESLENRIDELEYERLENEKKIAGLKRKRERIRGKLDEIWAMIDGWKEKKEYGYRTLEDGVRVLKLPEIGSDKGIDEALSGEKKAPSGEGVEEAKKLRKERHRVDAQMAANIMDSMSPGTDEDDWRLV